MKRDYLRECPFCGREAKLSGPHFTLGSKYYYVECNNCHVTTKGAEKEEECIRDWNKRAYDPYIPDVKKCPFCGGDAHVQEGKNNVGEKVFFTICDNCGVCGLERSDRIDAVQMWNQRVNEKERVFWQKKKLKY